MISGVKFLIKSVLLCGMLSGVATLMGSAERVHQFINDHPDALVLFYRPGCPYCRHVMPLFDAVQQRHEAAEDGVAFLKVDVSSGGAQLKSEFGFSTVPTFIYFKDGNAEVRHGSNEKRLKEGDIEMRLQLLYFE